MTADKGMMARLVERLRNGRVNPRTRGTDPAGDRVAEARLLEWGLAEEAGADICLRAGVSAETVSLFAGLVDTYDPVLKQVALTDCPMHFCTGLVRLPPPWDPASDDVGITIPAGGQGEYPALAAISCLGEMAERISLFSKGPEDPRIFEKKNEFGDLPLGPVLGFSARQEKKFAELYPAVQAVLRNDRIDWNALSGRRIGVTNLRDGRPGQIPAFGVLLGEREGAAGSVPRVASSSGAAVWSNLEEAAHRALLELVERDAFGRAWYNRLGITRVCPDDWDRILPEKLAQYLIDRARSTCVMRVVCDLDVHVLAAASYRKNGLGACLGVAAASTAAAAAFSAVAEMLQAEISLELSARAYEADRRRGEAQEPPGLTVAGTLRLSDELGLEDLPRTAPQALAQVYAEGDLERSCHARNIDLWRFDATGADLGIPCVKILSPHLCSWQPRFGKERLFAGGGAINAAERDVLELEFEKRPFPF